VLCRLFEARRGLVFLGFTLCWGGDLATTSMARSNRNHASGYCSTSFFESDFAMNPLSRVRPDAKATFGPAGAMESRPAAAAIVAQCIAIYAETEYQLGVTLALLLGTNRDDPTGRAPLRTDAKIALSMYLDIENRTAQFRMLEAAARASLPQNHLDVLDCVLAIVRSVMKERDKLAHWNWGWTMDLPEALLLIEPTQKLRWAAEALSLQFSDAANEHIFVVTESDLARMAERFQEAHDIARLFTGTLWPGHPAERARALELISNRPRVREALCRLHERRKNNPEARR
jgi:hypothetical protein